MPGAAFLVVHQERPSDLEPEATSWLSLEFALAAIAFQFFKCGEGTADTCQSMSTTANEALDGDLYETGKGKRKSNAHLFRFDRQYGLDLVAGVDEAGRAALAGPLVAAAVLFDYRTIGQPEQGLLAELNDSKKISAAVRERVRPQVLDLAAATATVIIPPDEIDRVGLHRSNLNALVRALAGLQLAGGAALPNEAALLVDGFALDGDRYRKVIRGDSQSAAIAAASIIAKTTHDRVMHEYAAAYPAYGFERHVGYLTRTHSAAVVEHGPSPIHRLSYQAGCYRQRLFDEPS